MEFLLILIGIFLLISLIFIFTHLHPLTKDEVESLAGKRRNRQIRLYFLFTPHEFTVNKEFKKRMNPNGTFYRINESLFDFPAIAAALMKYKKHEWIIIAFEKDKKIDLIWLNKGFDRSSVSSYLSVEDIIKKVKQENKLSVLRFHNHPNINPNYVDCSRPSAQDINLANEFAQILNQNGLNLLEFVCERGKHYKYFSSYSNSFFPLCKIINDLEIENNISKFKNLSLHFERLF